jgi:hypothetical protein
MCNMPRVYRRFEDTYYLLFLSASIYQPGATAGTVPYTRPLTILNHTSEFTILHYHLTRCNILITNTIDKLSLNSLKISNIKQLLFSDLVNKMGH